MRLSECLPNAQQRGAAQCNLTPPPRAHPTHAAITARGSRAQSRKGGDGRVYRVDFVATAPNGASCSGAVEVCVPSAPARRTGSSGLGGVNGVNTYFDRVGKCVAGPTTNHATCC